MIALKCKGIQSSFESSYSFLKLHFSLDQIIGMNSCEINFDAIVIKQLHEISLERTWKRGTQFELLVLTKRNAKLK